VAARHFREDGSWILDWLRIVTIAALENTVMNFGFHKILGSFLVAAVVLSSIQLVSYVISEATVPTLFSVETQTRCTENAEDFDRIMGSSLFLLEINKKQ
jgi:hypothetical protein